MKRYLSKEDVLKKVDKMLADKGAEQVTASMIMEGMEDDAVFIPTKNGERFLAKWPASSTFWKYWNQRKKIMKDMGFSCEKNEETDTWDNAICWLPVENDEEGYEQEEEEVGGESSASPAADDFNEEDLPW